MCVCVARMEPIFNCDESNTRHEDCYMIVTTNADAVVVVDVDIVGEVGKIQ